MTYASIEFSIAEGRPYYLYQFVEGDQVWRFTSRAAAWISAGSGGTEITWEPTAVAHGDVVQTSEINTSYWGVVLSRAKSQRDLRKEILPGRLAKVRVVSSNLIARSSRDIQSACR